MATIKGAKGSRRNSTKAGSSSSATVHFAQPRKSGVELAENPFFNRELSLLEFQRRVLEEAQDKDNPLIERVRFLSIFFSNMDEIFMVRVAGLAQQIRAGVSDRSPDGLTPPEQLSAIRKRAGELIDLGVNLWAQELIPALSTAGIEILKHGDLSSAQVDSLARHFQDLIFPVLTPLAYDPGHPFPHISNLSLNLAVVLEDDHRRRRFARIKMPESLPRLIPVRPVKRSDDKKNARHAFVWLEDLIAAHLADLFPGLKVREVHPFRVIRDAEMAIQELEAADLLETIEESVRLRRFGTVVRLMVNPELSRTVKSVLSENLEMDLKNIYVQTGPLGLNSIREICDLDEPSLKFPPHQPRVPAVFAGGDTTSIFDRISQGDILLHHPYDSFEPVVDFIREAATDPNVLAIKQTLYRVGRNAPIVHALLEARQAGKQVSVLVELKARFDEESNIEWARKLEEEGVHVIYGLVGLKTHSKMALVVRREDDRIKRYVHLSTGNYNVVTAQVYEDLGLFTCDEDLGNDATHLFNYLTGYSTKSDYRKLLVAPVNLRQKFEALIRREMDHAKAGRPAHVIFKVNSLADPSIVDLLYQASRAGVQVDLIVRGICCLNPNAPGTNGKIRVISVLGRFLEHSRVYWFANGGTEEILLGSADLMSRNLDHRVEIMFPVQSERVLRYIRDDVLGVALVDNQRARQMTDAGRYERQKKQSTKKKIDLQQNLLRLHR